MLTEAINWHWIFFVNVPIGVATAILAARLIDADEGIGLRRGADVPGAVLIVGALMLGVYTIVEAAEQGWASAHTLGFGGLSPALLAGFFARQATAAHAADAAAHLALAHGGGGEPRPGADGRRAVRDVLPRRAVPAARARLRGDRGRPGVPAVALGIGAFSLGPSVRLIVRFGARATLWPASCSSRSAWPCSRARPSDADYVTEMLPAMLLLGVGGGLGFPALMTLAMSGATPGDSGLASGLFNTTQQVGGALGLAVLAPCRRRAPRACSAAAAPRAAALTGGYHLAFAVGVGLVVAALVLALTALRPERALATVEEPVFAGEADLSREAA